MLRATIKLSGRKNMDDGKAEQDIAVKGGTGRRLTAAARRALAEAEQRRNAIDKSKLPKEVGGRDGPEPVRFGDWEVKGIASDF
jgi:hypothetical protein